MKGKIIITDKVYFEPDGLSKPNPDDYSGKDMPYFDSYGYHEAVKEHEASKRLVEVENVFLGKLVEEWFYDDEVGYEIGYKVMNNQPCKAEIKDNKATIIELIK